MGVSRVLDGSGGVQANCFQIGDQDSPDAPQLPQSQVALPFEAPAELRQANRPPRHQAAQSPGVTQPPNVLKIARQRRDWLRSEVKRLRTLEKELAEIERLLTAAKAKPRAAVRDISSNSRRVV